ncbi:MAG TPA: anti-phage dCTP deaminase [Bryobacteraceae bacterium]|nr:anti-phage dCTP deaminase [Bryobacteraceae bacterium]
MSETADELTPSDDALNEIYPDELVFAFVHPVGTSVEPIQSYLERLLSQFGYRLELIKLTDYFQKHIESFALKIELNDSTYYNRVRTRIDAGNELCRSANRKDFIGLIGLAEISRRRTDNNPRTKTAYLISSLKRPEEVELLRQVYGPGFFLIAIYTPEQERIMHLETHRDMQEADARELIARDKKERDAFGQNTSNAFAQADVFIAQDPNVFKDQLGRFVDLVFGYPFATPAQDEHNMFLAFAASLRSGDLARQVGAAISTPEGDVLAVGCNDVPAFGGGLYWPGPEDQRDHVRRSDSNEKQRDKIIQELLGLLKNDSFLTEHDLESALRSASELNGEIVDRLLGDKELIAALVRVVCNPAPISLNEGKELLRSTSLFSLTEFGRAVHAEMDALLTCGRTGRSTSGTTLYTTTFPCHNCTRHIIASGIRRVVYVEPYPKSQALQLHHDAISIEERGWANRSTCQSRVIFEPFLGIGPRRYFDLFSLKLGGGRKVHRKEEKGSGDVLPWHRGVEHRPRTPMDPTSYLDRELKAASQVEDSEDS